MVSSDILARLRFLNDAGHLLACPAPETSRHLMSRYHALTSDHSLDPEAQGRIACGACGTIIILGRKGRLEVESMGAGRERKREMKQKSKPVSTQRRVMTYTCDCCHGITKIPLDHPAKSSPHRSISISSHLPKSTSNLSSAPPASTTTIKKRTTSRRRGGLAAILAKQKESQLPSSGLGLDLMDFMKKS